MKIHALYTRLGAEGLIVGNSGNVSIRAAHGMTISPSGGDPDGVGAKDFSRLTLDGMALNKATPSSEWEMHAAIYRNFPDAQCVVHAHSDACTALASLHLALPPFHYNVLAFGGADVRCAAYVTFGTKELADLAVTALADRSACLLANHGMILYGRDPKHALGQARLLEALCRQYLLARAGGKPVLLTPDQIAQARERFKTYGPRAGNAASTAAMTD